MEKNYIQILKRLYFKDPKVKLFWEALNHKNDKEWISSDESNTNAI